MNSTSLSTNSPLDDLNPVQRQAAQATEGPTLILAGAGSGKTRALTYRVAYLIKEKRINPENILVLTFTNRAADEMKKRILKLLGDDRLSTEPLMGTFHSFCAKILRKDGVILGLPAGFSIYDETDALDAIKEALGKLNISTQKTSPYSVRSTISGAKNELISALEYPQYAKGFFQEIVAKVYLEYQNILEKNSALDFDDLLLKTIRLFQKDPSILTKYQIQFQYILIDEYQDTNSAQYLLSKYLAARHQNICVVGDASQSIYAFRGADFRNIVNFQKDYPNAKVFNLEQNYRSTQNILDAAFSVISKNKSHPILKLWTDNNNGEKIEIYEADNEITEATFIINKILAGRQLSNAANLRRGSMAIEPSVSEVSQKQLQDASVDEQVSKVADPNLADFAVLYRTNAQSRVLEEQFIRSGIPYRLIGGVNFYERKEIKDVLAYLRLFQNPTDSVSLRRAEKIGKGRLMKVMELYNVIARSGATSDRGNLDSDVADAPQNDKSYSTQEILDLILVNTGYLAYLDDGTDQGKSRIENVKELRSVAEQFPTLTEFLENIALVESGNIRGRKRIDSENQSVTLMTLHSAKGLEFRIVFMVGMEEGLFPHSRSMLNPSELEEERRLCYVGITRAKEQLYLSYARRRLYFGQRTQNLVSRFLADIPQNLIITNITYKDSGLEDEFNDDVSRNLDSDDWLNA